MKKKNPTRQAKRRKTYAQKLAAYKRSETYKFVEARAAERCEHIRKVKMLCSWKGECPQYEFAYQRCVGSSFLQHHHKTYARFGGKELPSDVQLLCQYHHEQAEAAKPVHRRRTA
jgi:hypothetical protein